MAEKGNVMKRIICLAYLISMAWWSVGLTEDRILVVHSYHETYDWVAEIDKAIKAELKTGDVDCRFFYMDTKRKPTEAWKIQSAKKAKQLVRKIKPQVVIAADDNAQGYFVREYVNNSPIQFVFCGVNDKPEKYGYPADNVTGILEREYTAQTFSVLKTLMPNVQKVAVVIDNSTTAQAIRPRILSQISTLGQKISLGGYFSPETFSAWKKEIITLNQTPEIDALLIPLYHTVRQDGKATSVASKQVLNWTIAHFDKPVVGLWPFIIKDGGLLAVTVNPHEHGRVAAQMAKKILSGTKTADIPIQVNQEGYVIVNLKGKEHYAFDPSVDIDQIADLVLR